ncbi:MAG: endonuclease III [Eubacterium sp.]|nr:endonuclease III [Eubacterium sp.]
MTKRAQKIVEILDENLGTDYKCYLNYNTPWQLLISTMLSAQCTDARVNIVTEELYKKYTSVEDFANADIKELEKDIHSIGFYHSKAKNIIGCAKKLIEDFGGEVPQDIESLTSLPGVGRKTANVIRGNIFDDPSIVVDTHVKRISKRLGLTKEEDPEKIEYDLMKKLPKDHWIIYNMQIISFGRTICTARSPKCDKCFIKQYCTAEKSVVK